MIRLVLTILTLASAVCANGQSFAIVDARLASDNPDAATVTIVVRDGTIASIGNAAPPTDIAMIDADGRPVTVPLFAATTQIGLSELGGTDGGPDARNLRGGPGRESVITRGFNPNALTVQQARADGVGHALIYPDGGSALFAGLAGIVSLNASEASVAETRAALFLVEESGSALAGGSMAGAWEELRDVLRAAPRDTETALSKVASGAMPLVLQVNREADLRQAIAITREFRLRTVIHGGAEAWRVGNELAAADIAVVLDPLDDLPFYYDRIGARRDNATLLARAGVRIAFFVSGQGIYRSWNAAETLRLGAGVAVRNGLSYDAALAAITSGPAAIWGSGGNVRASPGRAGRSCHLGRRSA